MTTYVKSISSTFMLLALSGCTLTQENASTASEENQTHSASSHSTATAGEQNCLGSTELPDHIATQFVAVNDPTLLNSALGQPEQGKLCQGQVYQAKADSQVILYRAWNSTNPYSQFGKWWAWNKPFGKVAQYRSDYEICYQWSPLDKLVSCTLKAGTKVVVGNGQSAKCSEYLTYDVSEAQQIFLPDAENALENCTTFDGLFKWQ